MKKKKLELISIDLLSDALAIQFQPKVEKLTNKIWKKVLRDLGQ